MAEDTKDSAEIMGWSGHWREAGAWLWHLASGSDGLTWIHQGYMEARSLMLLCVFCFSCLSFVVLFNTMTFNPGMQWDHWDFTPELSHTHIVNIPEKVPVALSRVSLQDQKGKLLLADVKKIDHPALNVTSFKRSQGISFSARCTYKWKQKLNSLNESQNMS